MLRCPSCGATNPESASWCGQCYADLGAEAPATPAPSTLAEPPQPTGTEVATELRDGFRRGPDGALQWTCAACGEVNSLDVLACPVCGASLGERYEEAPAAVEHSWGTVLGLSAVAPGAGHIAVRRHGSGVARLFLFVVWLLGGLVIAVSGEGGGGAAAPLLLGALVLWAGSLVDLLRLRQGQSELLDGRALLWLVVGVLGLSLLGLFTAIPRLQQ